MDNNKNDMSILDIVVMSINYVDVRYTKFDHENGYTTRDFWYRRHWRNYRNLEIYVHGKRVFFSLLICDVEYFLLDLLLYGPILIPTEKYSSANSIADERRNKYLEMLKTDKIKKISFIFSHPNNVFLDYEKGFKIDEIIDSKKVLHVCVYNDSYKY